MFLDLSFTKLLLLAVIALLVFGPDKLPGMAVQAGRALRELRRMAEGARSELQQNLPPELSQFDLADLNPKHFVRKHLMDDSTADFFGSSAANQGNGSNGAALVNNPTPAVRLAPGESPPYDVEAT